MSSNARTVPQSRLTGAVAVMAAQAVVLGLGFITHPIVGALLGPAPYGIYGIVLSLQSIFGLLLTLGVPVAISRFVAQDDQHAQSILRQGLRLQLLIGVAVAVLVAGFSPLLGLVLGDASLIPYIVFSAIVVFSQSAYPIFVQFFSGMHLFNRQAVLTSVYAVVKLGGAIGLLLVFGVYGALAGFLVGGLAAGVLGWFWTRGIGGSESKSTPARAFLGFAGVYVLILVLLQTLMSLDLFMIKAFLGSDEQTGYYNAAVTLSRISYMLLQALGFVLLPSVAKLTRPGASRDQAVSFISQTLRYLIMLIVPSVALASATSKELLRLFFFSTEYDPAAPALTVLMIGVGCIAFYLLLTNIVAGAGRPRVSLLITFLTIIVSAIAGRILIPEHGLTGAAWQTTIAGASGLIILALYTFKSFGLRFPVKSTMNVLVASAASVSLTYVWSATTVTLLPQYLVVVVVYIVVLQLLGELRPSDWQRVGDLHPRLRSALPFQG